MSFQLDWIQGNDIYNQTRQWMYRDLVHGAVTQPITVDGKQEHMQLTIQTYVLQITQIQRLLKTDLL